MRFESVSDMIEANGKTVRENNMEKPHLIPIGTLVEAYSNEPSMEYAWEHIRLYVVAHGRGCDGSPLYSLGFNDGRIISGGFSDSCLRIVVREVKQFLKD